MVASEEVAKCCVPRVLCSSLTWLKKKRRLGPRSEKRMFEEAMTVLWMNRHGMEMGRRRKTDKVDKGENHSV